MSQDAKVIALEHVVFQLLKELELVSGIDSEIIMERALHSIATNDYPGDSERTEAAAGALKDAWTFLGKK